MSRRQHGQVSPLHTAAWPVALAVALSVVAATAALGALALTLIRDAEQRTCRSIPWAALPDGAALPAGWFMVSNRVFADNLTTTLVGPAPTDSTQQQPAVYASVSCYGGDVQLALRRSHEAELAAGSIDVPFATFGDESFAVTSAGSGSRTVFLRRGILIAGLNAPSTLDESVLAALGQAIDVAARRVLAAGPDAPAIAQPSRAPLPSQVASPSASPSPLPESHVAPDLEALLPTTVDGTSLDRQSVSGTTLANEASWQALLAALTAMGKEPADLVIAQAADLTGVLQLRLDVYRVTGVSASDLDRAITSSLTVDSAVGATTSTATIGGHTLTKVTYPQAPATYFYEGDNVVFAIQSPDEDLVATVLGLVD